MKLEQAKRKDQAEGNTKRGAWRQAMQALRAEQAKAERIAKMRAELAEKMIPVVNWPYRWEYTSARPLDELVSAIGRPLTEAGHNETCEGHAAAFDPADGEVVWVCTDYKKHGHRLAGAPDPDDTHSPEADEKAAAEREAAREEARRVKTNNAAWRTAREVRQAFIVDMCQDKGEAPADVKDLVLTAILTGRYTYTHYVTADSGSLLAMFLKSEKLRHTPADEVAKLVKRTGAKRYWWLLFAHVAGMYEFEHMTDEAWRGKKDEFGRRKPIEPQTVEWLNFLRKHGYSLSEVEEETLATAQQQADEEAKRVAERAERDARWRRERAEADDTKQEAEDSQPDEDGEPGDQTDAGPAEDEPEDTADEPEDGTRADDGEQSAAEDE
ncbi:hypothetical protein Srubr_27110 [Streptomyces rubradiris]|nr:hypothetical protein [Streptomyces rubradiris]GHI52865.1 hypothetical protein Srubr_27110 [Streptomyces rubradiris]